MQSENAYRALRRKLWKKSSNWNMTRALADVGSVGEKYEVSVADQALKMGAWDTGEVSPDEKGEEVCFVEHALTEFL